jgi:hypothetical protein
MNEPNASAFFAAMVGLLAVLLIGTCAPVAKAHRMTGRDIRATGVHHCTWSAATTCRKKTLRRQIPCGDGRFCRW